MLQEYILPIMEWIGTVAFAVSGSLIAIGHGLDLFGVLIVGTITAVGGGMIRDVLIGNIPPLIFANTEILLVALLTGLLVFIFADINSKKFKIMREKLEHINLLFDSLGLAAFSVTGVQVACNAGYSGHLVLAIVMGVLTGVGGGVVRDMLVNVKPYVFTKHVYAVASLIGSAVYYLLITYTDQPLIGSIASLLVTITIRILAATFRWELPKIKLRQDS